MVFNNRGFSLVETLVSMAIVGIISLALAQLMRDSMNSANYSESKFDELELARVVQMQLMLKQNCENNFKSKIINTLDPLQYPFLVNPVQGVLGNILNNTGSAATGSTGTASTVLGISQLTQMVDAGGNVLFQVGDFLGNRSLKITNMGFAMSSQEWSTAQAAIAAGAINAPAQGTLIIQGERPKTTYGGKVWTRGFPVSLSIDSSGKVATCLTDADKAAAGALTIITQQFNNISTTVVNNTTNVTNTTPTKGCVGTSMESAIMCAMVNAISSFKF